MMNMNELKTREEAVEYAKQKWAEKFREENDGSMDDYNYSEFAEMIIQMMDDTGEVFEDIDLAMECWARDNWTGTIWE